MSMRTGPSALLFLLGLFVGYATGRRHGQSLGFREGLLFAPLQLRRLNCEQGYCTICNASPGYPSPEPDAQPLLKADSDPEIRPNDESAPSDPPEENRL